MQSQNKFASAVFGNWVAKILSFVFAVCVVVSIRFLNATDRVVTIPLDVTLPSDSSYTPVSLVPSSVDVVITGNEDIIYLVDPSLITASVDFSDVADAGIQRRSVILEYDRDIFEDNALSVSSKPLTVRILFEKKTQE